MTLKREKQFDEIQMLQKNNCDLFNPSYKHMRLNLEGQMRERPVYIL